MKLLSRTQRLKNTQEATAGGKAVRVRVKKNTIDTHWFQQLDAQESWMAHSKQAWSLAGLQCFSGTDMLTDADVGETVLKH